MSRSADFFERQFRGQVERADYALNPFERAILPHLRGEVLELGCGLGNLALAAAQAGCSVTALDASPSAIRDLAQRAERQNLKLEARLADLERFSAAGQYDCVVSVGLLMFFPCNEARSVLAQIREAVRPRGVAAINVLVEGTTYVAMFDPAGHCLFGRDELTAAFAGWQPLLSKHEDFPAPGETLKRFHTLVARRP